MYSFTELYTLCHNYLNRLSRLDPFVLNWLSFFWQALFEQQITFLTYGIELFINKLKLIVLVQNPFTNWLSLFATVPVSMSPLWMLRLSGFVWVIVETSDVSLSFSPFRTNFVEILFFTIDFGSHLLIFISTCLNSLCKLLTGLFLAFFPLLLQ